MDATDTTVIQVIIAGLLAYIAWQNYKINQASFYVQKDKLRLDLFERRLKIFESCQTFFSFICREGKTTREELYRLTGATSNAEFLFGKEIKLYIDEVGKRGLKLIHLIERLRNQESEIGDERNILANEVEVLEKWFQEQFTDNAHTLFRKYLHFSIDKTP